MRESDYQAKLIKELRDFFPGCVILKNDTAYLQGIPDLAVFYNHNWAMLEVKTSENAHHRPNQDHWIEVLDDMSFAAYIYPDNEEEVLDALQAAFGASR
jgi:hypothetical protein